MEIYKRKDHYLIKMVIDFLGRFWHSLLSKKSSPGIRIISVGELFLAPISVSNFHVDCVL